MASQSKKNISSNHFIKGFDEAAYLEANPDVKEAVERGDFPSVGHYLKQFGLKRIEHGKCKFHKDLEPFNTAAYLEEFPEVRDAIKNKTYASAFDHFCSTGYAELLQLLKTKDEILKKDLPEEEKALINGFDEAAYLEANPDVKEAVERGDFPSVNHYLKQFGLKRIEHGKCLFHKDFEPFDSLRYLEIYSDVAKHIANKEFISAFEHFCHHGYKEIIDGRRIWQKVVNDDVTVEESDNHHKSGFGPILHNPLVSIISVNYNGSNDLPTFLDSVSKQSYQNFELIIIDNGSKDNSKKIVKKYKHKFKKIKFINAKQNLGFAAGNNYALPYCDGELISLLNVDTKVDENWLKELVDAMSVDGSCAAVASKTLFFERFCDIEIMANGNFELLLEDLINSLEYKKYFVRMGKTVEGKIKSQENKIILSIPVQDKKIILNLDIKDSNIHGIYTKIGKERQKYYHVASNEFHTTVDISLESVKNASYIINNGGSDIVNGMPADRGIGEYDGGQYDSKCYVNAVCGVSVLLRRSAILDRKIFVSEFFAYYEDAELSRWIIENGYKILYNPRSILYHQHSATSSEGSPIWNLLVSRAQNLYNYNGNIDEVYGNINHLEEYFKPEVPKGLYTQLKSFSKNLKERLEKENVLVEYLKPIGIYNSYWNTKGGGESHALSFAKVLQKYETVYLISETDFSIEELEEYYGMDLSNCRKLIETRMTTEFTKKFDIFINSTYQSNLVSKAKKSFYIVYFPQKRMSKEVLDSYTFLYMNNYTKNWGFKYWGENHQWDIVCPVGMLQTSENILFNKEKIIMSVGRFFIGGHSKRQDITAQAFKELVDTHADTMAGWKLVLIGSLDESNIEHVKYVKKIEEILVGTNHEIITNAPREIMNDYFERASIYIHASGYGTNEELEPEKIEHFGITPIEAMQKGCYPIVYDIGGPRETLEEMGIGLWFHSLEELKESIIVCLEEQLYNNNEISKKMNIYIEKNYPDIKIKKLINKGK